MHHNNKIMIWLLMFLILVNISLAIGVSPIRKVVDFEPNKEYDLNIKIRNDGQKDIRAIVYARGELAPYIGIIDSLVSINKEEPDKYARYKLKLPSSFDKPGIHKADLVVMEYPAVSEGGQETMVSATASVFSTLWVRVPYPGKYAEAKLYIDAGGIEEDVDFAISVMNFGKEDIGKVKATIKILGATYEEIGVVETNEASVKSKEQTKLTAKWLADVNPGKYHVIAGIGYDEKKVILEDNFEVGNLFIKIKKIEVGDFVLGQVAIFDILLESKWNEVISDVYGEMTIFDNMGTEYTKFKTASIDMPPMGEGVLKAYWDTKGINVGKYNLKLLIHYNERIFYRKIKIKEKQY